MDIFSEEKGRMKDIDLEARKVLLSVRKGFGDDLGFYYLVKKDPSSGEERSVCKPCTLDDIVALIAKETEVYATLVPTCWRTKILANTEVPYELEAHYVIVEVLEKD